MRASKNSNAGGTDILGTFKYTDICATGELVHTTSINGEYTYTIGSSSQQDIDMKAEHRINHSNYAHCTSQLKSYLQMKVDGEWKTVMSTGNVKSSLYTNNDANYINRWLKFETDVITDTENARVDVKLEASTDILNHYGADKLKESLRVEMRHLVTAPWLPAVINTSTQDFTVVLNYRC